MSALVIAHAGHWAAQLLFLAPLIAIAVAWGVGRWREHKAKRRPDK